MQAQAKPSGAATSGFEGDLNRLRMEAIVAAMKEIRYGSVEITIHNTEVVQIERREKLRF